MQKAIIDLGTNTFHLLIADVEKSNFTVLYKQNIAVKLGKGGINDGYITEEALKRAYDALYIFKAKINEFQCSKIIATGTSALRNAKNGFEFTEKVKNDLGFTVQIIDGEKEAELIYKGVKHALNLGIEKSLIVDIGGGSVEFIIANNVEIFWKKSFEIGGQRLLDKFKPSEPIKTEEILAIEEYLDNQLSPLFEVFNTYKPFQLVGSSGSFDTFIDMCYALKNEKTPPNTSFSLDITEFTEVANAILKNPIEKRRLLPGMIELRVEMIVVATVLVNFLLQKTKINQIKVSSYALKEGVLFGMV
jgi:exopolyphosphatase / guanosine-5'-triphosphate,3'-diphosphate pyrophosphatase